jgi:hypothetical protein
MSDKISEQRRQLLLGGTALAALGTMGLRTVRQAQAQTPPGGRKPNILVIFGDDIGIPQISACTMGMMGYRTPNIDRIAKEGAIFTDAYGQQSGTAGRASFILGEEPVRTGLLTIGTAGAARSLAVPFADAGAAGPAGRRAMDRAAGPAVV